MYVHAKVYNMYVVHFAVMHESQRKPTYKIKTGRWHAVAREDRICKECGNGEVEDVEHWLLRCETWKTHREPLIAMVQEHSEVDQDDLAAVILSLACRNYKVLSFIPRMWHARFN